MIKTLKMRMSGDLTRGFGASLSLHILVVAAVMAAASWGVREARLIDLSFQIISAPSSPLQSVSPAPKQAVPKTVAKPEVTEPQKPVEPVKQADPVEPLTEEPAPPEEAPAPFAAVRDANATESPAAAPDTSALQASAADDTVMSDAVAAPPPGQTMNRYMSEHFAYIRVLIMRRISYPAVARKLNLSGTVLVSFRVLDDGRAEGVKVLKSSGFAMLDRNAVESVIKAQPFPPPPVSAELVIPVSYRID